MARVVPAAVLVGFEDRGIRLSHRLTPDVAGARDVGTGGGLEDAVEGAAKLAGIPGRPKLIYPRRRFSLREMLQNRLGLDASFDAAGHVLPALLSLRTPLYLMQ